MRVQDKNFATCAKMTEERSLNGGPNGTTDNKRLFDISKADSSQSSTYSSCTNDRNTLQGGSLKFFKDGKFILELSHKKEGDRASWVPVPKKTYWPPPAPAGTPRQESSASLSVSDDNSSVQSSPWQRDHCWKQSSPRHDISKEMMFFMRRASYMRKLRFRYGVMRRKRRRPYEPIEPNFVDLFDVSRMNINIKKIHRESANNIKLEKVIETLHNRLKIGENSSTIYNHTRTSNSSSCRVDPSIVSPRKRILREMERVSLEDVANSKRQRARTVVTLPQNNNGSPSNCTTSCQTFKPSPPQTVPKTTVSNYSITSLLGTTGKTDEAQDADSSFLRTLLKSPSSPESGATHRNSPTPSPSSSDTYSSSRHVQTYSPSHHTHVSSYLTPPPPPLLYTPHLPHYLPHPYYSPLTYRGSPSPWTPYSLPSLPRTSAYPSLVSSCHQSPLIAPCSWVQETHHTFDEMKREDPTSDVPLNLSKSAE